MGGAHVQWLSYHYLKFEYSEKKTVGNKLHKPDNCWRNRLHKPDTIKGFLDGKMSKFNTPQNWENIHEMRTK